LTVLCLGQLIATGSEDASIKVSRNLWICVVAIVAKLYVYIIIRLHRP